LPAFIFSTEMTGRSPFAAARLIRRLPGVSPDPWGERSTRPAPRAPGTPREPLPCVDVGVAPPESRSTLASETGRLDAGMLGRGPPLDESLLLERSHHLVHRLGGGVGAPRQLCVGETVSPAEQW